MMRFLASILAIGALVLATPAPSQASEGSAATAQRIIEASDVPGMSVALVQDSEVVLAEGFGRDSAGREMTGSSLVRIASMTKSFTATAVAGLAEDGEFGMDDPLAEWLPEFTMADPRHTQVTIRELMNHTSGLTDAGVHYYRTMNRGAASPQEYTASLAAESLTTAPGERFRYANINYVLLGRLVEVVSGQPIGDYLQAEVFSAHGLSETALGNSGAPDGSNSLYGWWFGRSDTTNAMTDNPAGGVTTTAGDLGRWLVASNGQGGRPVPAAVRAVVESPTPASEGYGGGWSLDDDPGWLGHGGNINTYNSYMMRNPETGQAVAVVVNGASMSDPAYDAARALVGLGEVDQVPSASATDRRTLLALLAVVGLTAGFVWRARAWARRRAHTPWRRTWGLVWPMPVLLAVILTPVWTGYLVGGIDMTWSMLSYYFLTPLVTILAVGIAAAVIICARLIAWRRT